jgi:hypothetical protein
VLHVRGFGILKDSGVLCLQCFQVLLVGGYGGLKFGDL